MNNPPLSYCSSLGLLVSFNILCLLFLPCISLTSFIFGDSLLDAGNNDYLFTLSKADSPPYGIDFSASGGQPTGRFTNGRTVSDIIGQLLGAKSFPPPFLAPNSQENAIHVGINYASGSAGILVETGSMFIGRIPLQEQVDYFEQTKAHIVEKMGETAANILLKNAIFSIAIGSNDILNYIQPSIPFIGQEKVEPSMFQDFMLSNLTMQLKRLHKLGASKFVVVGIGPLGCIPFVRAIKLVWFKNCSNEVNEFIQGYNRKLNKELSLLNENMGQEATFVYGNSYDIFMGIISNYLHYGFGNAKDPCCGGYFPPFMCFKGKDISTSSLLCEDRSKYIFWDAYHPTEAFNLIMAKQLLDGDQRITSPINIRQLYQY
ncbi:GDSL esterase/lipase At5g41890 [Beta vulgaris subsp. vulgaris]|uniref:GDSL esterase/lipase At5g41890 n=1 Tax=Beta vulgaris subsp. vulgaris TaxID=3555 RepID=UPI00053FEBC3|nr:GDSL esterase/lipase At5g41890 [Beta vulgaris subsp. vulgaris]